MPADIGIDLGTTKIIAYYPDRGVLFREPNIVAVNNDTGEIVAICSEAHKMLGRTPAFISAVCPMGGGVISNYRLTNELIRYALKKVCGESYFKPRVAICVPSIITDVEQRAVVDAAVSAGARKVFLIEEPVAAALGAGLDISKPDGHFIVAIGNGTASRETEQMAVELLRQVNAAGAKVSYMIVSEAGASVYSASKLAAEEFPQYDVNLRSAVSIARRLQDPLAELVKIDPKAIGVGQYQHDMPPKQLDEALSGVVEDCVNAVGVDINTASPALLQRVAGLNGTTAKNVVAYREENGAFTSRTQIKKVPKLGPKAFQQCAGFLRVPESESVLDNTAVHPESYDAAKALLELTGHTLADVKEEKLSDLPDRVKAYGEEKAARSIGVGVPTLRDIISELLKPGRDVRDELPKPVLRTDVLEMKDLKPGMVLAGTVRNVIDFGVFVDIGVHQDGLVHISQVSDQFIRHPSQVVSVGDVVQVVVLDVDEEKKRISLSMKQAK